MKVWVLLTCANIHDGILYEGVYRSEGRARRAAEFRMSPGDPPGAGWELSDADGVYARRYGRPVLVHAADGEDWIILDAEVVA